MSTTIRRWQAIERAAEAHVKDPTEATRRALAQAVASTEADYQCPHTVTRWSEGEETVTRCVFEAGHRGVCQ